MSFFIKNNSTNQYVGNKNEKCEGVNNKNVKIVGIQARATSVYFPLNINALFIPKWLHPVQNKIKENKSALEVLIRILKILPFYECV